MRVRNRNTPKVLQTPVDSPLHGDWAHHTYSVVLLLSHPSMSRVRLHDQRGKASDVSALSEVAHCRLSHVFAILAGSVLSVQSDALHYSMRSSESPRDRCWPTADLFRKDQIFYDYSSSPFAFRLDRIPYGGFEEICTLLWHGRQTPDSVDCGKISSLDRKVARRIHSFDPRDLDSRSTRKNDERVRHDHHRWRTFWTHGTQDSERGRGEMCPLRGRGQGWRNVPIQGVREQ